MTKKKDKPVEPAEEAACTLRNGETFDVAVVGGGAAGLACAVACAQAAPGARIAVLESGRRVGASIMRSGNGRCNFSNSQLDVARYHNAEFVAQALAALEPVAPNRAAAANGGGANGEPTDCDGSISPGDLGVSPGRAPSAVVEWFERLGLVWTEASGSQGMLFPFSNRASTVLDVLRFALDEAGVQIFTETTVRSIALGRGTNFELLVEQAPEDARAGKHGAQHPGRTVAVGAERLVVAAGGCFDEALLPGTAFAGRLVPRRSTLGPLRAAGLKGVSLPSLDGVRVAARVSAPARGFSESGEVLFRPYGVSGIVVFNASRYVNPGDCLLLDLAPSIEAEEFGQLLAHRYERFARRTVAGFLEGFFVPALARALMQAAGVDGQARLTRQAVEALAAIIKAFPLTVEGIADERQCQVRRGGLAVDAVDPATLEVHDTPGLYVVGETLDVDGPCGGYNLHWAWSSGILAGRAVARD